MGAESSSGLVRTIGRWSLSALIVNSIIGGGIFGLAQRGCRPTGKVCPSRVFGGGRRHRVGCRMPRRSRFAIQRNRRPLSLRADGARKILGNSNRLDDVVVATCRGLRHCQSFCHLSCGILSTRGAAGVSRDDSVRIDRTAGDNQLSWSAIGDASQRFSNQHKNISFADVYWRRAGMVDRTWPGCCQRRCPTP